MKYVCWHGKYRTYSYTKIINTLTYKIMPKLQTFSLDSSIFVIEDSCLLSRMITFAVIPDCKSKFFFFLIPEK